jgi:hypothetical protein
LAEAIGQALADELATKADIEPSTADRPAYLDGWIRPLAAYPNRNKNVSSWVKRLRLARA